MLEETINHIIHTKRERILQKMQKRIDEMPDEYWKQKWDKAFEMMYYYQGKPDEQARHKVIVLHIERLSEIDKGYRNIIKNAQKDTNFDVENALEILKGKIAACEEELQQWRRQLGTYQGSEKYLLRE